jgi:hypothetical protein
MGDKGSGITDRCYAMALAKLNATEAADSSAEHLLTATENIIVRTLRTSALCLKHWLPEFDSYAVHARKIIGGSVR